MGYKPEGTEQADGKGQLPSHKHTGDPAQFARSYSVFIPRCVWSLSRGKNRTRKQSMHSLYQSIWNLSIYPKAIWIGERRQCVQQNVGRGHEKGIQGFLDVISRQHIEIQWRTLGTFWAFNPTSIGDCSHREQDTTVQNQAVPIQGGVSETQDQQGGLFYDTRVCTEDQGVAHSLDG